MLWSEQLFWISLIIINTGNVMAGKGNTGHFEFNSHVMFFIPFLRGAPLGLLE